MFFYPFVWRDLARLISHLFRFALSQGPLPTPGTVSPDEGIRLHLPPLFCRHFQGGKQDRPAQHRLPTSLMSSITSINIGPLTTTFTPSLPTCTSIFYAQNAGASWLALVQDANFCLPSGFNREPEYFYSPGVCPSGYDYACTVVPSTTNGVVGSTVATCCPRLVIHHHIVIYYRDINQSWLMCPWLPTAHTHVSTHAKLVHWKRSTLVRQLSPLKAP